MDEKLIFHCQPIVLQKPSVVLLMKADCVKRLDDCGLLKKNGKIEESL